MGFVKRRYRALSEWVASLSRLRYAVLVGVVSGLTVVVGAALLLEGSPVRYGGTMAVAMTATYYFFDPTRDG